MTEILHELEAELPKIVGVKVVEDKRKKSKRYLRTTLKSYALDPVNVPVILVAGFNPNRHKCVVMTNDTSVIVSLDNPSTSSQTDTAGSPPTGAALHTATMGNGFPGHTIYGPNPIWVVAVTGNAVTRVGVMQHNWAYDD